MEKNTAGAKMRAVKIIVAALCAALTAFAAAVCGCDLFMTSSYDWAVRTIEENYVGGEFDKSQAREKTPAALAELLDPYSAYYTAEEYEALIRSNAGEFYGIGVTLTPAEGAGAMVVTVSGNSPAKEAGLVPGNVITGGEVKGKSATFRNYAELSAFIDARGKGEKFTLITEDGAHTLSRESFTQSYVEMRTNSTGWDFRSGEGGMVLYEDKSAALSCLPDGAAYVRFAQFYGDADKEFGKLVEKFNAGSCDTLILDLRNDGGGYVDIMQSMGGYFVQSASKTAMTVKYKNGRTQNYKCKNHSAKISGGAKVYVLANSGTASASEALLGVLIDYGITDFGNVFVSDYSEEYLASHEGVATGRTYGKGIMQSSFVNYRTGEVLKLTNAKIYWPNGKCIHGTGLTEGDGCVLIKTDNVVTKGDKELQAAVEIIKGRAAEL